MTLKQKASLLVAVIMFVAGLGYARFAYSYPNNVPQALTNDLQSQIAKNPEKELLKYLENFERVSRRVDSVTNTEVLAEGLRYAKYMGKIYKCGHHFDMSFSGPGCPISSWDVSYRKRTLHVLRGLRRFHLMAFDINRDGFLQRDEIVKSFEIYIDKPR